MECMEFISIKALFDNLHTFYRPQVLLMNFNNLLIARAFQSIINWTQLIGGLTIKDKADHSFFLYILDKICTTIDIYLWPSTSYRFMFNYKLYGFKSFLLWKFNSHTCICAILFVIENVHGLDILYNVCRII